MLSYITKTNNKLSTPSLPPSFYVSLSTMMLVRDDRIALWLLLDRNGQTWPYNASVKNQTLKSKSGPCLTTMYFKNMATKLQHLGHQLLISDLMMGSHHCKAPPVIHNSQTSQMPHVLDVGKTVHRFSNTVLHEQSVKKKNHVITQKKN